MMAAPAEDGEARDLDVATSAPSDRKHTNAFQTLFSTYELTEAILLNLPEMEALRAAAVCKFWRTLIEQSKPILRPLFTHKKLNVAPRKPGSWLVSCKLKGSEELRGQKSTLLVLREREIEIVGIVSDDGNLQLAVGGDVTVRFHHRNKTTWKVEVKEANGDHASSWLVQRPSIVVKDYLWLHHTPQQVRKEINTSNFQHFRRLLNAYGRDECKLAGLAVELEDQKRRIAGIKKEENNTNWTLAQSLRRLTQRTSVDGREFAGDVLEAMMYWTLDSIETLPRILNILRNSSSIKD